MTFSEVRIVMMTQDTAVEDHTPRASDRVRADTPTQTLVGETVATEGP